MGFRDFTLKHLMRGNEVHAIVRFLSEFSYLTYQLCSNDRWNDTSHSNCESLYLHSTPPLQWDNMVDDMKMTLTATPKMTNIYMSLPVTCQKECLKWQITFMTNFSLSFSCLIDKLTNFWQENFTNLSLCVVLRLSVQYLTKTCLKKLKKKHLAN